MLLMRLFHATATYLDCAAIESRLIYQRDTDVIVDTPTLPSDISYPNKVNSGIIRWLRSSFEVGWLAGDSSLTLASDLTTQDSAANLSCSKQMCANIHAGTLLGYWNTILPHCQF